MNETKHQLRNFAELVTLCFKAVVLNFTFLTSQKNQTHPVCSAECGMDQDFGFIQNFCCIFKK